MVEQAMKWALQVLEKEAPIHNNELYDTVPDELYCYLPDALTMLRKRNIIQCTDLTWWAPSHWANKSATCTRHG